MPLLRSSLSGGIGMIRHVHLNDPQGKLLLASHLGDVEACRALAQRLGLGEVRPRVIGRFSNLVLALEPTPWVARVAIGTAGPRTEPAWARREMQIQGVVEATMGMYGDLQGIAGRALAEIEGLDAPRLGSAEGGEE